MDSTLERTQIKDTMKTHLHEYQNNIRAIESCRFTRGIVLSNKIKSRQPIEDPKETIKKIYKSFRDSVKSIQLE
jgi:hypothetical protein